MNGTKTVICLGNCGACKGKCQLGHEGKEGEEKFMAKAYKYFAGESFSSVKDIHQKSPQKRAAAGYNQRKGKVRQCAGCYR